MLQTPTQSFSWMTTIQLCLLHTNAANMSALWKYLKLSEKDTKLITSSTHRLRVCLALNLMSPMRRGRVDDAGYCMMIGLKRLVNKLQNVMFSNTRTNCMQVIQTVRQNLVARGFKAWEICAKTLLLVSCSVTFAIRATNIFPNSSESFINMLSTKRSIEVFPRFSAKIKAPSKFINILFYRTLKY